DQPPCRLPPRLALPARRAGLSSRLAPARPGRRARAVERVLPHRGDHRCGWPGSAARRRPRPSRGDTGSVTEPLKEAGPPSGTELGHFAHGQFRTDYEARPDLDRLREARLARAQRLLAESELDALLVWRDENVRYLTGLRAQLLAGKSAL